ncbi:MAG: hypothetical protein ACOC2W_03780 [bacterium]
MIMFVKTDPRIHKDFISEVHLKCVDNVSLYLGLVYNAYDNSTNQYVLYFDRILIEKFITEHLKLERT